MSDERLREAERAWLANRYDPEAVERLNEERVRAMGVEGALLDAHQGWLADRDDPRYERMRARAGLATWRFDADRLVRAAKGKRLTTAQARDIIFMHFKALGIKPDPLAGRDVYITPDGKQRVILGKRAITFERGGRGQWVKDRRIHEYCEELSQIDFAMKLANLKRYETDPRRANPAKKPAKKLKGYPMIAGPLPAFMWGENRYLLWLARTPADKKAMKKAAEASSGALPIFTDGRTIGGPGTLETFMRSPLRRKHLYGGLMFRVTPKQLIVSHMVIEPKAQRRGLNTQMIEFIKKEFPGREVAYYDLTPAGDAFREARGGAVSKTNPRRRAPR